MTTWPGLSMRKVCRLLYFPRARLRARAVLAKLPPRFDEVLAERIQRLIQLHPTFAYRRLWALLRFSEGLRVNRKSELPVLWSISAAPVVLSHGNGLGVTLPRPSYTLRNAINIRPVTTGGGVAERLKAPVLKIGSGVSRSWVRIPPPPPANLRSSESFHLATTISSPISPHGRSSR
jgi:hypothetical protein